jgi:hypothetical protein
MLKVLSHRWLGVTVWAYLLSLSLALIVYWLLPKDAALHRWTFNGTVAVLGFTPDHSQMVVAIQDGYAFLDLKSGMVERVSALEDSERKQLVVLERLPYNLSYGRSGFLDNAPELDLVNTDDNSKRNVPVNDSTVDVADMYIESGGRSFVTVELSTSGMVAMSPDQSRLLLPSRRFSNWFRLKHWMTEKLKWSPSWLPEGTSHHMLIVNLRDNSLTEHELRFHQDTEFVINPAGTGFAVVDHEPFFQVSPLSTSKPFTISWFALPPGTAHHTLYQWLAIIGAFVIPVMLSVCRRKRHQPSVGQGVGAFSTAS